jgi:hypothetical protein
VAIRYALTFGFSDDASDGTKPEHVVKALGALERNGPPTGETYLAGHYFNDALLRLDIAYENALRRFTGLSGMTKAERLVKSAKTRGCPEVSFSAWLDVRKEVNRLKHDIPKQVRERRAGRAVTWMTVLTAARNLLPLIEKAIQSKFPRGESPRSTPGGGRSGRA